MIRRVEDLGAERGGDIADAEIVAEAHIGRGDRWRAQGVGAVGVERRGVLELGVEADAFPRRGRVLEAQVVDGGGHGRRHIADQAAVEPIYEEMDGWKESTEGARSWADLPAQAIKYIQRVQELIETPVALVSTSPEREDTILVRDPFED